MHLVVGITVPCAVAALAEYQVVRIQDALEKALELRIESDPRTSLENDSIWVIHSNPFANAVCLGHVPEIVMLGDAEVDDLLVIFGHTSVPRHELMSHHPPRAVLPGQPERGEQEPRYGEQAVMFHNYRANLRVHRWLHQPSKRIDAAGTARPAIRRCSGCRIRRLARHRALPGDQAAVLHPSTDAHMKRARRRGRRIRCYRASAPPALSHSRTGR